MKASILDLRRRMAEVLRALDRNETVKILYRGKERAVLVPSGRARKDLPPLSEHAAFGMWKNRQDLEDVKEYVRNLRKGRFGAARH
jgi:antitoxin (DNA-binding transcriptional repressor) of toxin-antitoxin stability system